jgi:hypothetical protein
MGHEVRQQRHELRDDRHHAGHRIAATADVANPFRGGRLWRGPFPTSPTAFQAQSKRKAPSFLLQSATRTVRLGGHVQSGTRRVVQKIRGNHSLHKQDPHQRASYGLGPKLVNDLGRLGVQGSHIARAPGRKRAPASCLPAGGVGPYLPRRGGFGRIEPVLSENFLRGGLWPACLLFSSVRQL